MTRCQAPLEENYGKVIKCNVEVGPRENFCDLHEKLLQRNTANQVVKMVRLEVAENGEPINTEGGPIVMDQNGLPCAYKAEYQAGKLFQCPMCGSYKLRQNASLLRIDIFCDCGEKMEVK